MIEIIEKECYLCKKTKKVEDFYELFVSAKQYFDSYCKQCRSDLNKEAHRKNPNLSRDRVRKSRENTKIRRSS